MKFLKPLMTIAFLCCLMALSAQQNNFFVEGNFNEQKGKKLLYVILNGNEVDSVVMKNGKFKWQGQIDCVSMLGFWTKDRTISGSLFLVDKGTYRLNFTPFVPPFAPVAAGKASNSAFSMYLLDRNEQLTTNNSYRDGLKIDTAWNVNADSAQRAHIEAFFKQQDCVYKIPVIVYTGMMRLFSPAALSVYFGDLPESYQKSVAGSRLKEQIDLMLKRDSALVKGTTVSDFSMLKNDSSIFTFSQLRGKYVLLDFWASWCKPCRAENPLLRQMYSLYRSRNFEIVSVSLDSKRQDWLKAIEVDSVGEWIHVSDLKGWKNEVAVQYGVQSIPDNVLIDPDGRVIANTLHGEALHEQLKTIFGEK